MFDAEGDTYACDEMRRSKDNRMIFGYFPVNEFIKFGGKKMQNPPKSRHLTHPSDVYTVRELEDFLNEMMPNFYEELTSVEEYNAWTEPRYSPKVIFTSRDEEVPLAVRKLAVHYFLRFDFAFVSDLTDSIIRELNVTSYPRLILLKYNFEGKAFETDFYEGDFS